MVWQVELSDAARQDFDGIIDWTFAHFGERQADDYSRVLTSAIRELGAGRSCLAPGRARNWARTS